MASEKGCKRDKNQNIQVSVRLRPLNQRERDIKSLGVVEVHHNREVFVKLSQQNSLTKKFTFDRAFGPNVKQVEVYQEVVSPLIEEVLAGYNCTVFAYGQTGTGKTHTMVGEHSGDETTWQSDPLAGIIPRALSQLFDELRLTNTEYTVRVSYLELYNEELFDLLSSSEDNSKLRIYEDVTRKGSNIVNGLEEITVYNKNEVYKIMAQGQERKRVASTLMNAQSSRSHTVFTIVVHMKENSPEGEELVKIGKLNLVDLAGSENISKAGSDNPAKRERARECVNINQSLLTLGRVITALVERHPHIPYRESKLTRILQESLGGRTKTSIIATVSPGHRDLEETLSTLEYAHRAKNIQNKPEVNQKMTKKAILKEYAEEIDRLKKDLQAARDKNGVYLANETYSELTLKQEEQRKEIQELLLKKRAMEEEREKKESVFGEMSDQLRRREEELRATKERLGSVKTQLVNTANLLQSARVDASEQRHLVDKHVRTESELGAQASALLRTADSATRHLGQLHDSVDRRRNVECTNLEVTRSFRGEAAQQRDQLLALTDQHTEAVVHALDSIHRTLDNFNTTNMTILQENIQKLESDVQIILETAELMKQQLTSNHSSLVSSTTEHQSSMESISSARHALLQGLLQELMESIRGVVEAAANEDVQGNVAKFVNQWYSHSSSRVCSLRRSCSELCARLRAAADSAQRRASERRGEEEARAREREAGVQGVIQQIEQDRILSEKRLTSQMEAIESERRDTRLRLEKWAEDERRILEERINKHVEIETRAMEERLSKKLSEIEEERAILTARISKHIEWQNKLMKEGEEERVRERGQLEAAERERKHARETIGEFDKDVDQQTSAITVDMEALSVNVVKVVEHSYSHLLQTLDTHRQQIQNQCSEMVSRDSEDNKRLLCESEATLRRLIGDNQRLGEQIVDNLQSTNTTTISTLQHLSTSLHNVISSTSTHTTSHGECISEVAALSRHFRQTLRDAAARLRAAEDEWLGGQYAVYKATGSTPVRSEYRYPRALAATSPHDKILARLRAARRDSFDEDCIVLESDESTPSECGSICSPAPSPAHDAQLGIFKSTSEIDIYAIKRQQENGKENVNRSFKKPSKLPAPASLKKPLVDRNGTVH